MLNSSTIACYTILYIASPIYCAYIACADPLFAVNLSPLHVQNTKAEEPAQSALL